MLAVASFLAGCVLSFEIGRSEGCACGPGAERCDWRIVGWAWICVHEHFLREKLVKLPDARFAQSDYVLGQDVW